MFKRAVGGAVLRRRLRATGALAQEQAAPAGAPAADPVPRPRGRARRYVRRFRTESARPTRRRGDRDAHAGVRRVPRIARPASPAGSRRRPCWSRARRTRCSGSARPTPTPARSPRAAGRSRWAGSPAATTAAARTESTTARMQAWFDHHLAGTVADPGTGVHLRRPLGRAGRAARRPSARSRPPSTPASTAGRRAARRPCPCAARPRTSSPRPAARPPRSLGARPGRARRRWRWRRRRRGRRRLGRLRRRRWLRGRRWRGRCLGAARPPRRDLPGQAARFSTDPLPARTVVAGAPQVRLAVSAVPGRRRASRCSSPRSTTWPRAATRRAPARCWATRCPPVRLPATGPAPAEVTVSLPGGRGDASPPATASRSSSAPPTSPTPRPPQPAVLPDRAGRRRDAVGADRARRRPQRRPRSRSPRWSPPACCCSACSSPGWSRGCSPAAGGAATSSRAAALALEEGLADTPLVVRGLSKS